MAQAQSNPSVNATAVEAAWDELRGLVGAEHVREAGPGDAIAGLAPRMVAEPGDEKELAAALSWANDAGLAVAPRGGGTKLDWGNPPARLDLVICTARMDRILEHVWSDMTVIVQAGAAVAKVQQALAQHGQRIATDPLWPERATIGGILSTNDSGALRLRFGALRDLIIGVTLALPDGTLAKSGGKVVKNVAGYDLPKLATGALGTLGVITQAAFRLHPLPPGGGRTLTFQAANSEDATRLILAAQDSQLAHTGLQARFAHDAQPAVDIRFDGTAAGIEAQSATARKLAAPAPETESSEAVWQARERLWDAPDAAPLCAIFKLSVLPSRIAAACEALRRECVKSSFRWRMAVQGNGLGWVRLEFPPMAHDAPPGAARPENYVGVVPTMTAKMCSAIKDLRGAMEREAGSLFVAHRPAGIRTLDAWGSPGDAFPVMLRLKNQLDPRGTLNPGRFVGGI
jgi:glycolate dehydrogenase FAD-binding subunit